MTDTIGESTSPPAYSAPLSLDTLRHNLGAYWSDDSHSFLAHWAGLRAFALIPATEKFLDTPLLRLAPQIYIVELIDDVALVRLQGTALDERWTTQLTGRDLHEGLPDKVRQRSMANMRRIVAQPCGYLARNVYATSLNRAVTDDLMQLPLGVRAGRPPRVVCLTLMERDEDMGETVSSFHTDALTWLDLGAGVPEKPPLDLLVSELFFKPALENDACGIGAHTDVGVRRQA